jgi:3-deoxy-7-phosphoheptulonate synthase
MIIVLKPEATESQAKDILAKIEAKGLKPLYMPGVERIVLGALGDERALADLQLKANPIVDDVKPILTPYKQVSREFSNQDTKVQIGDVTIGGKEFCVMSGPCAVESYEQLSTTAAAVKKAGASILRGGVFKPRSSPYSFQGMGLEGLKIMKAVGKEFNIPTITEVMDEHDIEMVVDDVDALQLGARNMQNFRLLRAAGETGKPILLKRGIAATIEELLLAAEYIVDTGNQNVILCERGIRTYETATRNTLDLNAVAYLKQKSHLPVIVDPSHGTGIRELVTPLARAGVAVGADGLMVETHYRPDIALSDGKQSLYPEQFEELMKQVNAIAQAMGR